MAHLIWWLILPHPPLHIHRLQVLMNRVAGILCGLSKYDHVTSALVSLHWLPVKQRINFKIILMVYKSLNGFAPGYLANFLIPYCPSRDLRSSDSGYLRIPAPVVRSSFQSIGPRLWNDLPISIRECRDLLRFRKLLKSYLFSIAFK